MQAQVGGRTELEPVAASVWPLPRPTPSQTKADKGGQDAAASQPGPVLARLGIPPASVREAAPPEAHLELWPAA